MTLYYTPPEANTTRENDECRVGLLPEGLPPLGLHSTERAANVIFGPFRDHYRISARLGEVLDDDADLYAARAAGKKTDGPVDRAYWLTSLVDGDRLREISKHVPLDAIWNRLAGVGTEALSGRSSLYAEIDDCPADEQIARYVEIEQATGIRWALWVSSGGKSVHAYIATSSISTTTDRAWFEAQRLLCVLVGGDHTIASSARRLMRLPGHVGQREQPILLLREEANGLVRYDVTDVRERLRALYERRGGTDVERSLRALSLAKRLADRGLDAGLVDRLRSERIDPSDDLLWMAEATLDGTLGFFDVDPGALVERSLSKNGKAILRVPASQLAPYRDARFKAAVEAPCCSSNDHSHEAGVVLSRPGESPVVYCHRCVHTVVALPEEERDEVAPEEAVDLLDALFASFGPDLSSEARQYESDRRTVEAIFERGDARDRAEARDKFRQPWADELALREARAAALDPARVEACREVLKAVKASDWESVIRKQLVKLGLLRPNRRCGFETGLYDLRGGGARVGQRRCGALSCYVCGPRLIARKAMAAGIGPVTVKEILTEQDSNGAISETTVLRAVAGGLATREVVYAYAFAPIPKPEIDPSSSEHDQDAAWARWQRSQSDFRKRVEAFQRRLRRACERNSRNRGASAQKSEIRLKNISQEGPKTDSGLFVEGPTSSSEAPPIYVEFHRPGGGLVVLSSVRVPGKYGARRIDPKAELRGDRKKVLRTILDLTLMTYGVESPSLLLEGFDGAPLEGKQKVVGKITSSRNLHLDPDEIVKVASPHEWVVVERRVSAEGAESAAKEMELPIVDRTRDEFGLAVVGLVINDVSKVEDFFARAKAHGRTLAVADESTEDLLGESVISNGEPR